MNGKVINRFEQFGFVPVSKNDKEVLLKSNRGVAAVFDDGNYEAFVKSGNQNQLKEGKTGRMLGTLAVLAGMGLTYLTTDVTIVSGNSMYPRLQNHQIILRSKFKENVDKILMTRGAIIKFRTPDGNCIKRIIGVPGDTIEFGGPGLGEYRWVRVNGKVVDRQNLVYHMGSKLKHYTDPQNYLKYLREKTKYKLGADQYFVMGDNREISIDSRSYGPIDASDILAVVAK